MSPSDRMMAEFRSCGPSRLHRLAGGLEAMGALERLAWHFLPIFALLAAGGLGLLMLLGVGGPT